MPRNSSGTYSLYTPGNPVVTNTVISSTWANNTLADLASALTDSLSRTGDGGMQAPLELTDGAVGAPALTWATDTTSGWYRNAADDYRFSALAGDVLRLTSTGLVAGAATGGLQGAGTINATGFYDDGVQIGVAANPTGTIGLAAVNGSATTYLRSDGAPALSQAIVPTWTGAHTFTATTTRFSNNDVRVQLYEADAASDEKLWDVAISAKVLALRTRTDANGSGVDFFSVTRGTGTAIASLAVGNTANAPTFTFLGTGVITAGGVYRGPVGSTSAPTYSWSGDTNTGFYQTSTGNDDIAMSLGGTGYLVGFRAIPRSTTATTFVIGDVGRCVAVSAAINIPISVFAAGDAISVYNDSGSAVNITISAGTLRLSGTTSTGTRSLAARGTCLLWFNVGGATPEVIASGDVS